MWLNVLEYLEDHDADLESLERIVVGGSAAPKRMIHEYREGYGVVTEHAWGMTETMSIGSVSRPKSWMDAGGDAAATTREKQGLLAPGLEMKIVDDDGQELPWDGETPGELLVRGPTVIDEYYNRPGANEEDFEGVPASGTSGKSEDGPSSGRWLRTGDIATVDGDGYMGIVDRDKDVIKSGGEWISSIELENALMSHDAVSEAAVISVSHDTWQERPVAFVVLRGDAHVTDEQLQEFLGEDYPGWWLPDAYVYLDEIPKTSTGKFDKMALGDEYGDVELQHTPGSDRIGHRRSTVRSSATVVRRLPDHRRRVASSRGEHRAFGRYELDDCGTVSGRRLWRRYRESGTCRPPGPFSLQPTDFAGTARRLDSGHGDAPAHTLREA